MVIEYRRGEERFRTLEEGRTTWHSFSFGRHYDPGNVGFAGLVAHNEEHLPPGTGYADHPHADVEIVTWVLTGALRHTSTVGTGVIGRGQVQHLRAGSGVVHSEVADGPAATSFLQAWLRPDTPGLPPDYATASVPETPEWTRVADGDGEGLLPLASIGTSLHVAHPAAGASLDLPDAAALHVFLAEGSVLLGERLLRPGDAARLRGEGGRTVRAEADSHLVVWTFRG